MDLKFPFCISESDLYLNISDNKQQCLMFDDLLLQEKLKTSNKLSSIFKGLRLLILSHPQYNKNSISSQSEHHSPLFASDNTPLLVFSTFKSCTAQSIKNFLLNKLIIQNLKQKILKNTFDFNSYNKNKYLSSFTNLENQLCINLVSDNSNNIFDSIYIPYFDSRDSSNLKYIVHGSDDYLLILLLSKLIDYFLKSGKCSIIKTRYEIHTDVIRYILKDVYGIYDVIDEKFHIMIDIILETLEKIQMFCIFEPEFLETNVLTFILVKYKQPLIIFIDYYGLYKTNVLDSIFFTS